VNEKLSQLRKASARLEFTLGRAPTLEELAEQLELPEHRVRDLVKWGRKALSLHMLVGDESDSELMDLIQDDDAPDAKEHYRKHRLREGLQELMGARLRPREREVLGLRYGLTDHQSRTLEQVAETLGVTRERVRQIEKRALRRLRHASTNRNLREMWI
jgi:DNA-directed RNA polymerase sigma subunit (sigma70/sigma32)